MKLKTAEEVASDPDGANPMESACYTVDFTARFIRDAVNADNREALLEALRCMDDCAAMIRKWVEEGTH